MTYENTDVPLWGPDELNLHVKYTGSTTWICTQKNCDGVHHYYEGTYRWAEASA